MDVIYRLAEPHVAQLHSLYELFDFYARHGFTNDVGAIRLMRFGHA